VAMDTVIIFTALKSLIAIVCASVRLERHGAGARQRGYPVGLGIRGRWL
jgi:hypothetical protein